MDSKFIRSRCLVWLLGMDRNKIICCFGSRASDNWCNKMCSPFYSTVRHSSCQKHCYGLQLAANKIYNATRGQVVRYNTSHSGKVAGCDVGYWQVGQCDIYDKRHDEDCIWATASVIPNDRLLQERQCVDIIMPMPIV